MEHWYVRIFGVCFLLLSAQRFVEYGSYFLKTGLKCVSFGKYESEIYCKCFTYCWVSGTHFACAAHRVPMKHRVEFDIKRASGKDEFPVSSTSRKACQGFQWTNWYLRRYCVSGCYCAQSVRLWLTDLVKMLGGLGVGHWDWL